MDPALRKSWPRVAILVGVLYFVAGYGSATVDPFVPDWARFAWRMSAWAICAALFAAHVAHEHTRPGSSPIAVALHVASAVALGGFLLAAAAMIHAATTKTSSAPIWLHLVALVA